MVHTTTTTESSSWEPCDEVYTLGLRVEIQGQDDLTNDTKGQKSKKDTKRALPAPLPRKGSGKVLTCKYMIVITCETLSPYVKFYTHKYIVAGLECGVAPCMKRW